MTTVMRSEPLEGGVRVVFTEDVTAAMEDEMAQRLQSIETDGTIVVDCTHLAACRTSIIAALIALSKRQGKVVLDRVPALLRETIAVMHIEGFFELRDDEDGGGA